MFLFFDHGKGEFLAKNGQDERDVNRYANRRKTSRIRYFPSSPHRYLRAIEERISILRVWHLASTFASFLSRIYYRRASFKRGLRSKNPIYPEGRGEEYSISQLPCLML